MCVKHSDLWHCSVRSVREGIIFHAEMHVLRNKAAQRQDFLWQLASCKLERREPVVSPEWAPSVGPGKALRCHLSLWHPSSSTVTQQIMIMSFKEHLLMLLDKDHRMLQLERPGKIVKSTQAASGPLRSRLFHCGA